MNRLQRIAGRIQEFFSAAAGDIIGRVRSTTRRWRSSFRQTTNNWGRGDYDYYRRLHRCQVVGMELSALLIRPITSKLSAWTLGRPPTWKLDSEPAQEALAAWWEQWHPAILRAWQAALRVGDSFLVINSDLSITLLAPDCVDPIVADDDYSLIIGWRVTQVLQHPDTTAKMTVTDEYYIDRRVHRVEVNAVPTQEITYPNLLGRLPIVHIPNQPDTGETFGHAEAEALLALLHKYGEVFEAAIEGNVLQGRPTPVLTFETVADLAKFDEENATTSTQTLTDGRSERVKTYDVDLSQLLVASGATFDYKSPGSFTADTAKLLELMFYLLLEHSELPEFVFGNAISSSKASAETQMPIFQKFIEGRRGEMSGWLTQIAEIALAYLGLITPGVSAQAPALQWEELASDDGRLTLDVVTWAYAEGLLDKRTALLLSPLEVADIDQVLERAKTEQDERQAAVDREAGSQMDKQLEDEINALELDI